MDIGDAVIMAHNDYLNVANMQPTLAAAKIRVPDVDATFKRAVEKGFKPLQEPKDMFWGARHVHAPQRSLGQPLDGHNPALLGQGCGHEGRECSVHEDSTPAECLSYSRSFEGCVERNFSCVCRVFELRCR